MCKIHKKAVVFNDMLRWHAPLHARRLPYLSYMCKVHKKAVVFNDMLR